MTRQPATASSSRPRKSGAKVQDAKAPLYRQLVQTLKTDILNGIYPVGAQLPTEEELCVRFEVSRHTVREALRQLRNDGLVSSRQGAGTTVLRPGADHNYVHGVSSINDLFSFATRIRYQVDSSEMIVSDADLVERIGGKEGQRWLRIQGFRYADEQQVPVCWTEVFIDADYAGVSRLLGRRPGPIFELIEDLYGERISEVDQVLRARPVPEGIASTIQADPGTTVIEVKRVYRVATGKIAEVAFSLHPADRFEFAITLRRVKSSP
jgi:GntR family transcriptional regulator